jgi:shikimate dehydrogenase
MNPDTVAAAAAQARIDGGTRLYAIIGDPIAQVKSPRVLNPRFVAAAMDAVMVPVHVRPDSFEATVKGLMALGNLDGLVVTVPYKTRILPLLDTVLPMAAKVGAANAMRREPDGSWSGDMFDGRGLVCGLDAAGITLERRRVMLIGAGGAGSAVAVALADAGVAAISIFDIDPHKATALADRVAAAFPDCDVHSGPAKFVGHDILINATPIGMAPTYGLPVSVDGLTADMLVIDIIMEPETTPLVAHARAIGCRTFNGRVMLDGQAEELIRFFRAGGHP